MFSSSDRHFELQENEILFQDICQKLKNHLFHSPWKFCFNSNNNEVKKSNCEVQEFNVPLEVLKVPDELSLFQNSPVQKNMVTAVCGQKEDKIDEDKFAPLKTYLLSVEEDHHVEDLKNIELLNSLSLLQLPHFCAFFHDSFLNETSVALFLNSISKMKKPLSITIAAALVKEIIYPEILSFESSNYRNLSLSIVSFFGVYPKPIIDELLVPCLKRNAIATPLQDILLKMIKNSLLNEHVSYCIKSIINECLPTENTFVLLQILIEKKIPYENHLHNAIAFAFESWASENTMNMKFIKLVISILSIYGSELTDQQIKIYYDVVKINKTIMKKAAENVIKNLKTD